MRWYERYGYHQIHGIGKNTIYSVGSNCTYAQIVADCCEQKEDPNRVFITIGGNLTDYHYELTTQTADLTTSKVMWSSVIEVPRRFGMRMPM